MAGDWIKMRSDLLTHPKVVRISSALKADRLRVCGGLFAVWCLFDAHSVDGKLIGYTDEVLDALVGFPGFAAAMRAVDWLKFEDDSLVTPRFSEHNGHSAKRRANDAERKRESRNCPPDVPNVSALQADKKRTREEKRRSNTPIVPLGFERFWLAWPPGARKQAKGKCCSLWVRGNCEPIVEPILAHVESLKASGDWSTGFVPAPLVYLNQRRWEGAEARTAPALKVAL